MKDNLPTDVTRSLEKLRSLLLSGATSQTAISKATGVDQSQISRILSGNAKRVSKNVIELCKYSDQFQSSVSHDPAHSASLMGALRTVWNGTPEHAEALARVILSLREFPRT